MDRSSQVADRLVSDPSHAMTSRSILGISRQQSQELIDHIAVERPLAIRLIWHHKGQRHNRALSMTMRTPGNDEELVAGFLFAEGVIGSFQDIEELRILEVETPYGGHQADVILRQGIVPQPSQLNRQEVTNSSCGVCAKTSIEDLAHIRTTEKTAPINIRASLLMELAARQRDTQTVFAFTGGVHATSLFATDGRWIDTAEDVGRHNAFDKMVGRALMRQQLPLSDKIVVVSGRSSFELVQKAACAGVQILCAVGAPSSFAIELAAREGICLVGFLRDDRLNIYTHPERIS